MTDELSIDECLERLSSGDLLPRRELSARVYGDLKRRAAAYVQKTPVGAVGATTLLHETYLRLIDRSVDASTPENELFAIASKIMRDLLVDFARRRSAQKRGGQAQRITLSSAEVATPSPSVDLLDVHTALEELAAADPRLVQLIEMRYFGGRTIEEIASATGTAERTLSREFALAEAWLRRRLAAGRASND